MSAIIFDTETTGINDPEAIEAAWIKVDNPFDLTITDQFLQRYQPSKGIELGALSTHHIMDEDLVGCPPSSTFQLPPDTQYLIGHNVDYDWKVIGEPKVKRICTLALARHLIPEIDSHTQSALVYLFERSGAREMLRNAHSAYDDILNCRVVLYHLLHDICRIAETTSWEQVWQLSEDARIPRIMTFGKHKGMAIKDVPADYKRWLLNQPDVDPYLMQALRA